MPQLDLAAARDMPAIRALLERAGLPTNDLASAQANFAVVREEHAVVATGALQHFGPSALLRSVVVASDRRGGGLGRMIVWELERRARAAEVSQLVLLTETAADFFQRLGYRIVDRNSAPAAVQMSEEFRSLCPSSATCMAKSLT
jgi:amino-acid N-acetyltransferase